MNKTLRILLVIVAAVGVGAVSSPLLLQSIRAGETSAGETPERLASLEQRVATLEYAVEQLERVAPAPPQATPGEPPAAQPDAPQAKPAGEVTITPINQVRRGQPVVLRGEVERLRDEDEFVLRDTTGSIEIYIGWQNPIRVKVGDTVTVHGTADDDVFPGRRPDVYARSIELPDGTTQRLKLDE